MIKLSRKRKVILMTPNPYYPDDYLRNIQLFKYVKVVRQVAKKYDVRLVDNYQNFSEAGRVDVLPSYYKDDLHLNAKGYQLIFNNIKGEL
jgi:lysophospholipase L1-like esterase